MHWFLIALAAPALWSASNHIDKYLLEKHFSDKGVGALLIFSSVAGLLAVPVILLIDPSAYQATPAQAFKLIGASCIYFLGLIPYFKALSQAEASVATPFFQTIPLFYLLLAYLFLGETLTTEQLVGSAVILAGATLLSFELAEERLSVRGSVVGYMLFSSFLMACSGLVFKLMALEVGFASGMFWEGMGSLLVSVLLFLGVKEYRRDFLGLFRAKGAGILGLNVANEAITLVADACIRYAGLLAPLALVQMVNGFQPVFVFFYGILLTLLFPKISRESLMARHLFQKIIAILVIMAGTLVLNA